LNGCKGDKEVSVVSLAGRLFTSVAGVPSLPIKLPAPAAAASAEGERREVSWTVKGACVSGDGDLRESHKRFMLNRVKKGGTAFVSLSRFPALRCKVEGRAKSVPDRP
jgi:hypothetical protein